MLYLSVAGSGASSELSGHYTSMNDRYFLVFLLCVIATLGWVNSEATGVKMGIYEDATCRMARTLPPKYPPNPDVFEIGKCVEPQKENGLPMGILPLNCTANGGAYFSICDSGCGCPKPQIANNPVNKCMGSNGHYGEFQCV